MARREDPETAFTTDAFHRGAFHLVQPAHGGHRAGMDAMLLAAAVPDDFTGVLADLGAGAGAAGLAVLSRCAHARAVLIEKSEQMAEYARQSLALQKNERFIDRADVLQADVSLRGTDRSEAGLRDRSFNFVIMNPPFNKSDDRRTPHVMKAQAHVMEELVFESWLRTAAAILKPDGRLALIARPQSLAEILNALNKRFGGTSIVPVLPKSAASAIRIIVTARRGSRAGITIAPAIVLHGEDVRNFTPRADALINGKACLFADN